MPGIAEDRVVPAASPPTLAGPLSLFGFRKRIYTTSQSLTADDLGCAIFTTGATTAVTFTLPAGVPGGANVAPFYLLICGHVEGMVVSAAANTLVAANDATATSITTAANAGIGAFVLAVSDGTSWYANGFAIGTAANGGLTVA
jgi:hypothetical protein